MMHLLQLGNYLKNYYTFWLLWLVLYSMKLAYKIHNVWQCFGLNIPKSWRWIHLINKSWNIIFQNLELTWPYYNKFQWDTIRKLAIDLSRPLKIQWKICSLALLSVPNITLSEMKTIVTSALMIFFYIFKFLNMTMGAVQF